MLYALGTSIVVASYVVLRAPRHLLKHVVIITSIGYCWLVSEGVVARNDVKADLYDVGFELTRGLNVWFHAHPGAMDIVAFWNTVLCQVLSGGVVIYEGVFRDNIGLGYSYNGIHFLRTLCGLGTLLPTPIDIIKSDWDFPNSLSAHSLFLFSGHQASYAMYSMWLFLSGRYFACFISVVLSFISCLFMVVTRGHYTVDIIIGTLVGMGFAVHQDKMEAIGRALVGPTKPVHKVGAQEAQAVQKEHKQQNQSKKT